MDKQTIEAAQNELVTSLTKSHDRTLSRTGLPISWISALFKKLQAIYGSKWNASIDGIEDVAVTEWSQGLAGITGEQLRKGLDNLDDDWPPSLPAFRAACLGKKANGLGLDYVPECYRTTRPERTLESDELKQNRKEWAKKGVNDLKNILK